MVLTDLMVLIFMVLNYLYATYWSLWYLLIYMVLTDLYGTYWCLWYLLIFMVLIDLYGTYWSLWHLPIFMALTDLYGTYRSLWHLMIFMVLSGLYETIVQHLGLRLTLFGSTLESRVWQSADFLCRRSSSLGTQPSFLVPLPNKLIHLYLICCIRCHRLNFV